MNVWEREREKFLDPITYCFMGCTSLGSWPTVLWGLKVWGCRLRLGVFPSEAFRLRNLAWFNIKISFTIVVYGVSCLFNGVSCLTVSSLLGSMLTSGNK